MEKLRIGLVADIHAGTTRSNIRSDLALPLLDSVAAEANAVGIDLFVTLGDNVNATNPSEDRANLAAVKASLDHLVAPVVPLFGNNEYKFLGRSGAAAALGCSPDSEMRTLGGWSLLFWRPACELSLERGLWLADEDIAWLEAALDAAAYPAVLFLHAPIDGHSMVGNYYFEQRPDLGGYVNAGRARTAIEASGKIVLVLSGHVHWHATSLIGGVHYRTLPSLTDTFEVSGEPTGAWALLELDRAELALSVFGRQPLRWAAPPRLPDGCWRKPMEGSAFETRMQSLWQGMSAPA